MGEKEKRTRIDARREIKRERTNLAGIGRENERQIEGGGKVYEDIKRERAIYNKEWEGIRRDEAKKREREREREREMGRYMKKERERKREREKW